MIALGVADWPLTRDLLAAGRLEVDFLETPGFLAESAVALFPRQPFLLHNSVNDWSLGHPAALAQQDVLPRTLHLLEQTHAPWLSVHLGFSSAEIMFDVWTRPRSPVLKHDELFANICRNARTLAAAIPVPLILENLDYCPDGAYEYICAPDFITAVLDETGTGLLLDVAHARVSAAYLGLPIASYLAQLPLERVRQLHISGPRLRNGVLADAHESLLEEDYTLLQAVLRRADPLALTLEYARDAATLHEQLTRLRAIL